MKKEIVLDGKTYVLKDESPKEKEPEFKVGDWIQGLGGIGRINTVYSDGKVSVIDFDKEICIYRASQIQLLTPKEIESYLIEEAKRRGFVKGCTFKDLNLISKTPTCDDEPKFYYGNEDDLYIMNTNKILISCIYIGGKWAEIIKEEEIKIGNYKVEIDDEYLKVGCKNFILDDLIVVRDFMNLLKQKNIHVSVQDVDLLLTSADNRLENGVIKLHQIESIIEKLK